MKILLSFVFFIFTTVTAVAMPVEFNGSVVISAAAEITSQPGEGLDIGITDPSNQITFSSITGDFSKLFGPSLVTIGTIDSPFSLEIGDYNTTNFISNVVALSFTGGTNIDLNIDLIDIVFSEESNLTGRDVAGNLVLYSTGFADTPGAFFLEFSEGLNGNSGSMSLAMNFPGSVQAIPEPRPLALLGIGLLGLGLIVPMGKKQKQKK